MADATRYLLTLETPAGADADRLLRLALKSLGRRFGCRCVHARENAVLVRYDLDGLLELTLPLAPGVQLPAAGDGVRFGPPPPHPTVYAHVVARQYEPFAGVWEVHLARHPDGIELALGADEEAAWRACGFTSPKGEAP